MARSEGGQGAAVLCSGGLDSAVLLAEVARREAASRVLPIYVSVGLAWEPEEIAMIDRLLVTPPFRGVLPLATLRFDMRDVYPPTHWAIRGVPPAYDTPDEDVYLAGRNLVLLTKAGVVAAKMKADRIALGPLSGNPFPDARPEFFRAMAQALSLGLDHALEIATPFLEWEKDAVIQRGVALGVPFEFTLSCMNPVTGASGALPQHCGLCSKCRERRDAFVEARVPDPSTYANEPPR